MTYIPGLSPISPLSNIMYTLTVSSQEEDFIFDCWACGFIEMGDVLGEALPLGVILEIASLTIIFSDN